jgi:hypothetical protein
MAGHWLARRSNDAMLRKGSCGRSLREERWQPKARSGTRHTPPWRAERRGCFGDKALSHTKERSAAWRATPSIVSRAKGNNGLPGAANNTGGEALAKATPERHAKAGLFDN